MKKKAMLAMAIIMLLGSVKALASQSAEVDPAEIMNTPGKLYDSEVNVNLAKVQEQIEEMNSMQDRLAEIENSGGLMRDLGQTKEVAEQDSKKVSQTFDLEQSRQLVKNLDALLVKFRKEMKNFPQ